MCGRVCVRDDFPADFDADVSGRLQDVDTFEGVFGVDVDFCVFFEPGV